MNLGMKIVPTFGKEKFISLEMDPQLYMGVSSIHRFWKKTNLIEAMFVGQKTHSHENGYTLHQVSQRVGTLKNYVTQSNAKTCSDTTCINCKIHNSFELCTPHKLRCPMTVKKNYLSITHAQIVSQMQQSPSSPTFHKSPWEILQSLMILFKN
jgi:hypothetical protein